MPSSNGRPIFFFFFFALAGNALDHASAEHGASDLSLHAHVARPRHCSSCLTPTRPDGLVLSRTRPADGDGDGLFAPGIRRQRIQFMLGCMFQVKNHKASRSALAVHAHE